MKQDTLEFELQMFQKANTRRFTGFSRAAKENDVPGYSATTSSLKLTKVLRTLPSSLEDQSTTLGGGYEVFSQTQNQKQTSSQLRSVLGSFQSNLPTPKSALSQVKKSKQLQLSINSSTASVINSTSSKSQKRRNNTILNQIHNTLSQPTSTTSANTRQQRKPANKSNTAGLFRSKAYADSAKPSPKVFSITVTSPQTFPQSMESQHFVEAEKQRNRVVLTNHRQSHSYSLGLDETLQLSHPSMQFNKAEESQKSQESFTTNSGRQNISKNSANPSKKQDQESADQNRSYQNMSFEEAQALALMNQATTTAGRYFQLDSSQISSLRQSSRLPVPQVHPLLENQFAHLSKQPLPDPSLNQSSEIPKFDYKQFVIQRSASSKESSHVLSSQNTSRSQAEAASHQFSRQSKSQYEDSDGSLIAAEQRQIQSISAAHPQSFTIPYEGMNYKSTESGNRPSKKDKKMKGTIARFINQALARQQRRSTSLSNPVLQSQQRSQGSCSHSNSSKEIPIFAPCSYQPDSESEELTHEQDQESEQSDHVSEDLRQPEELLSDVEVVPHHKILSHRFSHRHAEVQYVADNMLSIEIGSHRSHPKQQLERQDANSRHSAQVQSCFSARVSETKSLINRSKESSGKQRESRYGIASSKQTVSPKIQVASPCSRSSASRCSSNHQKSINSARASSVKVRQSSTKQSEPKRIRSLQQSSNSAQQKQSVDSSLTATSSHFLHNDRSKAHEDEVLMQLLRHQLRIIASKVEYYANIITIEEIREFSYLTTPPSTAFFKAGRCIALLLKSFTAMDPDFRQIKDEETFTKWERIQQYLNSQQGEQQLQRLGKFRQFCDTHFQFVDKTTLCSVLRKEIFSYTLVVKDKIEQVELDLESPRVKNPPVKPYFCIAYFIMTYVTLLDMAGKQQRKINDSSEIFKTDTTNLPLRTLDTKKESSKRSTSKKVSKKTKKNKVKSLVTQKTSGSGLSQSQTTLSIRHTSQNSSSIKMKTGMQRKHKELSKNLVVRAIQQELNTSKSEKRAKKEKIATTVKKIKYQSLSQSPMSKTPPSVVRQRPVSRQKLVRDSSNEAYGNQESGSRTHNVRQAILNAESDGSQRYTPTQPGMTALVLEKSYQDTSKTRGGMDMFSSHLNLNSSAKAPMLEKEQVMNIQIEDKSDRSEGFYRLIEEDSRQNTTEDSQIMPTIRVGAEHALQKAESSKLSLANPLPIKPNTEFTFQSQGSNDHRKSYANDKAEIAAAYQTGPSRTPDHNARVSDFLTHTINSCAKKGAPVRVDDLIKKIKFEYESQDQSSTTNLLQQRSQSYTKMPQSDNKSPFMLKDEGNSWSSQNQAPIQIPLVKYTAQSVQSSEQLSDCYMQRNYDIESDRPAQKVNLLAAQSLVKAGSARVAYPELVSSQGSLFPVNLDVFDELKELAADKESGRIQEVAGEGLVASKLELAFEEFYRQKSTSRLDSDRCSDVTSEKSVQHLDQSVIEEAQAVISSRSSNKYASRAKSICENIVVRELSDDSNFAISPEKKGVEYKMSRTPAQIVNSLKKRARARSHGKRLFETTIKNKTTEIVQSIKDFVKSTDPNLNCFGGQVADFDLVKNSLKKGNFTSVTKGRNAEEVNSIVKKFAFASSRKDGSPASVCKFEPTEPDFQCFVNSLAQTANINTKKQTMGSEVDFNLTGLQKLSDRLISEEADPEQGAQMRTFSLSDYTTSDFAKTYSSTQMITERIFARINEFKKQRTQLLEQ